MIPLRTFFSFALFWLALLMCFNFFVDPIQYYRKQLHPLFVKNMRYQIPGLVKQYDFDTVFIGTSHSANFLPSELDKLMGSNSINLSVNGSFGWEQSQILIYAFENRKVANVVWEMNYRTIAYGAQNRVETGIFPLHLYQMNARSDLLYLFSIDTAWQSVKHLLGRGHRDIETINSWEEKFRHQFDGERARKHYCIRKSEEKIRRGEDLDYRNAVETYVLPTIIDQRDTTFYLFLPPLSYFNYLLDGEYQRFVEFRKELYLVASQNFNVVLLDFSNKFEWIGDAKNYKDVEHFSPAISSAILAIIARRQNYVEDWNVNNSNRKFAAFLSEKRAGEPPCRNI